MQQHRVIPIIVASIACAWTPLAAHGQTTAGATSGTAVTTGTASTGGTTSTSGTTPTSGTTAAGTTSTTGGTTATTTGTATGTTVAAGATTSTVNATESQTRYLTRLQTQYPALTSKTNLESLVHGLRTGSAITLTSAQGTTATSTTFTPPTRPMGYGNITRAITLATRQLAAAGIRNPTPQQLQTALMGGTLTTAHGTVQMQGVLQLRSQGMGWGQIAHNVGVQPGMGKTPSAQTGTTTSATSSSAGITTATGASVVGSGKKAEHTTTEVRGRGIVTAAGASVGGTAYRGQGNDHRAGSAIVAANSAMGSHGMVSAAGSGHGPGTSRGGGKH